MHKTFSLIKCGMRYGILNIPDIQIQLIINIFDR